MPDVSTIPAANALYNQLLVVNSAIAMLGASGTTVTYMTITPAAAAEGTAPVMPVSLNIEPPVDDPATLADISPALQHNAEVIKQALTALGYTADAPPGGGGTPPDGDLPKPPNWPDDLPWPPVMPPALPGMMGGMPPRPAPMAPPPPPPPMTPSAPPPGAGPAVPRR